MTRERSTRVTDARPLSEAKLVMLLGAVQFVNVLDFMMVMPLGPDFAAALRIPTSKLGFIGGSYTAAACLSGLLGSLFLDRIDRRKALGFALAGLVVGTLAGGFATDLVSLIAARLVAGAFGGPATSTSLAIIADAVEPARRGRAMGAVMGAFSIASVFGVPAGLELARIGGFRLPFFAVAALGAVLAVLAVWMLPPFRAHLAGNRAGTGLASLLKRSEVVLCWLGVAVAMVANFGVIPHLSTYFQLNRGYPR